MKKILIATLLSIMVIGLVACGDSKDNEVKNVPVADIMTGMKEQLAKEIEEDSGENLLEEDGQLSYYAEADLLAEEEDPFAEMFIERSEINKSHLAEGVFLAPMMNVNSNKVIVLKAKDKEHVDGLKEALERELEADIATWEQYLPDQYEKVKKNVIKTNGNYLTYITTDDSAALEKIFDEKLK